MKKSIRIIPPPPIHSGETKACGSRKKGGCSWGGATKLETKIKVAT